MREHYRKQQSSVSVTCDISHSVTRTDDTEANQKAKSEQE